MDLPATMTDRRYAAELRARIDEERAITPLPGTTQVSTLDADGSAVSVTHSVGTGSGVVTPGLGFMLNNNMMAFDPRPGRGNSIAPGKRAVYRRRADPRARERPGPLRPRLAARRPEDQRDGPRPRRARGLRTLAGRGRREPADSLRGRPRRHADRAVLPDPGRRAHRHSRRADSASARITTEGASV